MSGLNPFRPKKPETPQPQPQHPYHQSSSSLSTVPDPIFLAPSSTAPAPPPSLSCIPTRHPTSTTPPAITPSDIDGSVASGGQSTADPFHQYSDLSDENDDDDGDVEETKIEPETSIAAPDDDHRSRPRAQEFIRSAPLPVSPSTSSPPSPTVTLSRSQPSGIGPSEWLPRSDSEGRFRDSPSIASSSVSIRSSRGTETSGTDDPRRSIRTGSTGRPASSAADIEPGVLASRPGNREKKPPPPPKSHHGKLITPDTNRPRPPQQTTPGKPAKRLSSHASSPGASISPKASPQATDYFARSTLDTPALSTDTLRRSQSQHKRPPTPPLSRRHSQMRRSKSTQAKPTASRLSIPPTKPETRSPSPSSPVSRPLTPTGGTETQFVTSGPGEPITTQEPTPENVAPSPSIPPPEVPGSVPKQASKRASLANPLPPPPPPRRSRGAGNRSGGSNRNSILLPEQRVEEHASFVPHPSNANDILADLSRLQKEVDDLRGHYENRRAS